MLKSIFSKLVFSIKYAVRWLFYILPTSILIGTFIALFLWLLNLAIHYRFAHPWLLYLLPLAGIGIHFLYKLYGQSAERGNNLIIDEIHKPGAGIPKRMAPLILITTVITHLFGGSAGREGTAVQIGGSLANFCSGLFKLNEEDTKTLLTAGVAAGFGAVFGTPVTGAIFAVEVLAIGRISYKAFLPCLLAGYAADTTVNLWHIKHTHYHIDIENTATGFFNMQLPNDLWLPAKAIIAAIAFGLAAYAFTKTVHGVKTISLKIIKTSWLVPVVGGIVIIALNFILGKPDYLSLGVDAEYPGAVTIVSAFKQGGSDAMSWLWKLIFTAITLGTDFKGGEVTPLFYIGATLGNTLAGLLNAPVSLFAALGFIAVFSGATKTPLACTVMGMELFGPQYIIYFALACFTAYVFSGEQGIYSSQQIVKYRLPIVKIDTLIKKLKR